MIERQLSLVAEPFVTVLVSRFDAVDGRDPDLNVIYDEVNKHVFIVRQGGSEVKVIFTQTPLS